MTNKQFRMRHILFGLVTLLVFASCSEDETVDTIVDLPSNLVTSVTVNEKTVTITATASGAENFSFLFIQGDEETFVVSEDGTATHTFVFTGTHQIRTRAYASKSSFFDFIEKYDSVIIEGDDPIGTPTEGYSTPMEYPGYELVWNDEFEGNSLSSDWVHEIGNGTWGWGNNELEYYRSQNTSVADGLLTITARQQFYENFNYTSSRIKTQGKQAFKYGRVDIRAALPYGKGIWPALWMLGENFSTVGWPSCGEIDIMELIGGEGLNDRTVHGTLHWNHNNTHASYGGSNSLPSGEIFAEEFHVFSIIWNESQIRFYRDDIQYHVMNIAGIPAFHEEFFFIFNVAVGGNWPGAPNATTVFPQKMMVDYVRVFQED